MDIEKKIEMAGKLRVGGVFLLLLALFLPLAHEKAWKAYADNLPDGINAADYYKNGPVFFLYLAIAAALLGLAVAAVGAIAERRMQNSPKK